MYEKIGFCAKGINSSFDFGQQFNIAGKVDKQYVQQRQLNYLF